MWPEEQIPGRLRNKSDDTTDRDSVAIRELRPGDLKDALEIDREVFGGYDPVVFTTFYEYHPRSTLVADVGGTVAGFVLGFKHRPFEGRVFWLAVKPAFQGRGIGTMLLLDILKIFRLLGALSATLEVRVSNRRAQSLYSALGFQMTGVFPGYYSDGEAALIMKRRL